MGKQKSPKEIKSLIDFYESVLKGMDSKAEDNVERAYGGIVRAGKGELVEGMAKRLVKIAWQEIGGSAQRLTLEKQKIKIPVKPEYNAKIKYFKGNSEDIYYGLKTDVHVYIDGEFKIAIECKAFTENAMLKRILVDFTLLQQMFPDLSFVLFQLESQLGGDYSTNNIVKFGSPTTHTLLSYFDIDLNIITLLEGERKVDQPIHKAEYYKSLPEESLLTALQVLKDILKK